jgi:hypothetical protein
MGALRPAWLPPARGVSFLLRSSPSAIVRGCPDDEKLTPADPSDIADSIAFALLFSGRKRVHDSDKYMAAIVADRIVRHLERAGFVVMKKPPAPGGGDNPGRTGTPGL